MSQCRADERPRFTAPIDIDSLSKNTAGDRKLERELLALFREQTGRYLSALEGAADDRRWRDAAHTLKGAARAVGATRIATLAEEAEGPSAESASTRHVALEGIRRAIEEARRFIDYQLLNSAH